MWIKNADWRDNPNSFVYRFAENERSTSASIENVQEFGIYNFSKYIRARVEIDRSSGDISKMDYFGNAVFHTEQLFLKVLIEGEASLYMYEDGDLRLFFFQAPRQDIRQLIYKKYIVDPNTIASNVEFREQLGIHLKCDRERADLSKNLNYYKSELIKYFITYHRCKGLSLLRITRLKSNAICSTSALLRGLVFQLLRLAALMAFRKKSFPALV